MVIETQRFEPFNVIMVRIKPGTDVNGVFRYLAVKEKLNQKR